MRRLLRLCGRLHLPFDDSGEEFQQRGGLHRHLPVLHHWHGASLLIWAHSFDGWELSQSGNGVVFL